MYLKCWSQTQIRISHNILPFCALSTISTHYPVNPPALGSSETVPYPLLLLKRLALRFFQEPEPPSDLPQLSFSQCPGRLLDGEPRNLRSAFKASHRSFNRAKRLSLSPKRKKTLYMHKFRKGILFKKDQHFHIDGCFTFKKCSYFPRRLKHCLVLINLH